MKKNKPLKKINDDPNEYYEMEEAYSKFKLDRVSKKIWINILWIIVTLIGSIVLILFLKDGNIDKLNPF